MANITFSCQRLDKRSFHSLPPSWINSVVGRRREHIFLLPFTALLLVALLFCNTQSGDNSWQADDSHLDYRVTGELNNNATARKKVLSGSI